MARAAEILKHREVQIAALALPTGAPDPVPRLFLDSWDRLSPVLKQSLSSLSPASAAQFTSFIGAMDGIKSLANVGSQFGLFRITPDARRGEISRHD